MKRKWLLPLFSMLLMVFIMRAQGGALVQAAAPGGIIDLEFARSAERLQQLQSIWQLKDVKLNIYLDFLFIGAYVWFFATAAKAIRQKRDWSKGGRFFVSIAFAAGLLDVAENILMLQVYTGKMDPAVLTPVYYCAFTKFLFIAVLILYLLVSLPFIRRPKAAAA